MKLVFLGQVGSGKGTYASRISKRLGIPHISTGQLLRDEISKETETGKKAKIYVEKADWGAQEIHDIIMKLVKNRIAQSDSEKGFIFDGFPRTLKQAEGLEKIIDIDMAINITVPENVIISRITSRRTCRKCGEIYNVRDPTMRPEKEGICDKCGGELYQREDETEEMTKKRIKENDINVGPVIEYYREKGKLKDINWNPEDVPEGKVDVPIETMINKILNTLEISD